MSDRKLILTGFMGSGKSTVGSVAAERLGCSFIDLDAEIVAEAGCSINEFFAIEGEQAFRLLESSVLQRVLSTAETVVIATGGGVVLSEKNRLLMRNSGFVVNLNVTMDLVLKRLAGCSDRPLLAGDDAAEHAAILMNGREQFYADSDIRIDTNGKSVEDIAAEIISHFKGFAA